MLSTMQKQTLIPVLLLVGLMILSSCLMYYLPEVHEENISLMSDINSCSNDEALQFSDAVCSPYENGSVVLVTNDEKQSSGEVAN